MEIFIERCVLYLANFLAILIILPLHEFAHAFAAVKCGDDTPKLAGRYTLNPFAHFDPIGLVMMILIRFGWAKPVPVNPDNFRNRKSGCIRVSIAGVLVNLTFAIVICPLCMYSYKLFYIQSDWARYLNLLIQYFIASLFWINVSLFVFNMLPIYPLDGFRLLESLTGGRGKFFNFVRRYGFYILLGIFVLGYIADWANIPYLDMIGYLSQKLGNGIILLWQSILKI